jgi:hypothetical protein
LPAFVLRFSGVKLFRIPNQCDVSTGRQDAGAPVK